ncbi:MAG: branched-chain amino acid ABC transporter permease [Burkholderiaceae bacterium]
MSNPRASGYFRIDHAQAMRLVETRTQKTSLVVLVLFLAALPFLATPFVIDLANQSLLATVGAVALMLLTGFAGQVSLGHAGLLAAGAFATGILVQETGASFWLTLPASALTGLVLGLVFGLPSLRLRGLYLAISTLALHFIVIYLGNEYETKRGLSSGIVIEPPRIAGWELYDPRHWYLVLLVAATLTVLLALNLLRSPTGRAWRAIHGKTAVAEAMGIDVRRYKLAAFVISSILTAMAGCLFAYFRGFVSAEAFSLFVSIEYVAMVIIGGMGSILGAVLGAIFVTVFPYAIEALLPLVPGTEHLADSIYSINYMAFGLVMIAFLLFEPQGLVGIWRRVQNYFLLWPYGQTRVGSGK